MNSNTNLDENLPAIYLAYRELMLNIMKLYKSVISEENKKVEGKEIKGKAENANVGKFFDTLAGDYIRFLQTINDDKNNNNYRTQKINFLNRLNAYKNHPAVKNNNMIDPQIALTVEEDIKIDAKNLKEVFTQGNITHSDLLSDLESIKEGEEYNRSRGHAPFTFRTGRNRTFGKPQDVELKKIEKDRVEIFLEPNEQFNYHLVTVKGLIARAKESYNKMDFEISIGKFMEAIDVLKQIDKRFHQNDEYKILLEDSQRYLAICFREYSNLLTDQKNYDDALQNTEQELATLNELQNKTMLIRKNIAECHGRLGKLYLLKEEIDESIIHLRSVLDLLEHPDLKFGSKSEISEYTKKICDAYFDKISFSQLAGNYKAAEDFIKQVNIVVRKIADPNDTVRLAIEARAHLLYSIHYIELAKHLDEINPEKKLFLDQAISLLKRGITKNQKIETNITSFKDALLKASSMRANFSFQSKDYVGAVDWYRTAIDLSKELQADPEQMEKLRLELLEAERHLSELQHTSSSEGLLKTENKDQDTDFTLFKSSKPSTPVIQPSAKPQASIDHQPEIEEHKKPSQT